MRTGRPMPPISVTEDQRSTLESWARRPKTAQALALRAKIILACAEGKPNRVVARQSRVRQQTVGKWRSRFLHKGLEGLLDEPRPGTPRRVSGAEVEKVLTTTLESLPRDATH
jgi:transposase